MCHLSFSKINMYIIYHLLKVRTRTFRAVLLLDRGVARISSRRGPNLQGSKVNPLKIQKVIGFHPLFFGGGPNKLKKNGKNVRTEGQAVHGSLLDRPTNSFIESLSRF